MLEGTQTHQKIKNIILTIENKYPVDCWIVNGIHVWPYIRIKIYFLLLTNPNSLEKKELRPTGEESNKQKKSKLLLKAINSYVKNEFFFMGLKQKKIIFFGSHIHRVLHGKEHFNRFFDSMVSYHELENDVYMVEHQRVYSSNFNNQAILPLEKLLANYKIIAKLKSKFSTYNESQIILDNYEDFLNFLKREIKNSETLNVKSKDLDVWTKKIKNLSFFYDRMFKIVQPDKIMFPGYYGWDNLYAAVYTANKLKIKTIDFQHGPQTNVHMAFSSWTKIPASGYEIMPIEYWNWDENSKKNIEVWSQKTTYIKAKNVGQPYLEYWKLRNSNLDSNKKTILYSLQLMPLAIMFTEAIAFVIQDSRLFWEIRLHPRNEFSIEEIEKHLERFGVDKSKYNIHNAREIPLPEIMSKTAIHVTAFSGSLIEAKMMGVPSIIISSIGKEIYEDYIDDKLVFYLNQNEISFKSDFFSLCDSLKDIKFTSKELTVVNPILA